MAEAEDKKTVVDVRQCGINISSKMDEREEGLMKKECAIVLGITDNYTYAACNVLVGLKQHCRPFWDDVIIYCDQLSDANEKTLQQVIPCVLHRVEDYDWVRLAKQNIPENRYSVATMFRYMCFDLLSEYRKVVWLDADILIQNDISGLLDYADKTGYAATRSFEFTPVEANFTKWIDGYEMFVTMYNAGMLVLSDVLPQYEKMRDWCVQKTTELGKVLRMPDQGILNLMLQEFHITPEVIDIFKYCCFPDWKISTDVSEAYIVHPYSAKKFWNDIELNKKFPEWSENNAVYLKEKFCAEKNVPVISVLMSVYERTDYLDEAINSILHQTFSDFELIVVVEYSDRQEEICNMLGEYHDSRIVVLRNDTRLGFAASLNVGIEAAKGVFIARMDDDDISELHRFERQLMYYDTHPEIDICGTYARSFMQYSEVWDGYPLTPESARTTLLFGTPLCHPSAMIRKAALDRYGLRYSADVYTEDYDLWARAIEHLNIGNVPEILLNYRLSGNNVTWRHTDEVHFGHLEVMRWQLNHYLGLYPTDSELSLINGRINMLRACYVHNVDAAERMRNSYLQKIFDQNARVGFYNAEELAKSIKNRFGYDVTYKLFQIAADRERAEEKPVEKDTQLQTIRYGNSRESVFLLLKRKIKAAVKRCIKKLASPFTNYLNRKLEKQKEEIFARLQSSEQELLREIRQK